MNLHWGSRVGEEAGAWEGEDDNIIGVTLAQVRVMAYVPAKRLGVKSHGAMGGRAGGWWRWRPPPPPTCPSSHAAAAVVWRGGGKRRRQVTQKERVWCGGAGARGGGR
eukprot:363692-Chlamydomonas_euryale.AAC.10